MTDYVTRDELSALLREMVERLSAMPPRPSAIDALVAGFGSIGACQRVSAEPACSQTPGSADHLTAALFCPTCRAKWHVSRALEILARASQ